MTNNSLIKEYPFIYNNIIWDDTDNIIIKNRNNFIKDYHIKQQSLENKFIIQDISPLKLDNLEIYDNYFGEKILTSHFKNIIYNDTKKLLLNDWLLYPSLLEKKSVSFIKKIYLSKVSL